MDRPVVWSPEALEDLSSIVEYIARDSRAYARAVASKILATTRSLPEQPYLGRAVPEVGVEAIRERFVYSYRLVYRVEEDIITVLAIIHGRRLLESVADRIE
ncbi:MAG: hypothetical protein RLZ44_976 [Pseudomonadota bacterium]